MSQPKKVGLFVAFTLALIAGMILNFSQARGLFAPTYTVRIVTDRIGGLTAGAPVTLSGVPVGNVSSIDLTPDRRSVEISARILRKYPIHGDARFGIEQSGFLGDEFVAIVPQRNEKPILNHGAVVQAETAFNLQDAGKAATALLVKLDRAVEQINSTVERVDQRLLTDETLNHLAATAANFRHASAEATDTLGDVRRLITNHTPAVTLTFSNLTQLTARLGLVVTNVDLFIAEQKPALSQLLSNASETTADLKLITADLREGKGPVGALLKDDALRLQLGATVTNFAVASSNLARFGILYRPPQPKKVLTNQVKYPGRNPWK